MFKLIVILGCAHLISGSNELGSVIIKKDSTSLSSRCQEITIPMCKTIRYNYTEMPNSFNHETQEEAGLEVHQYWPLVEIKCSDDLKFFICSLYVPICMEDYAGTVPPCRSVCERARAGCEPVMTQYGFFWPERMACDQFPKFGKNSICMDEKGGEVPSGGGSSGGLPTTNNNNNILRASPGKTISTGVTSPGVVKKPVAGVIGVDECNRGTCKCEYPLVSVDQDSYKAVGGFWRNTTAIITGTTPHCLFPCRGYGYSSQEEIRFANYWLTFWSSFTCSVSTLTILTYLIDSTRFSYPERPIICISFCYIFVSIGYLIRIYVGHAEVACGGADSPVVRYPNTLVQPYQNPSSPACTLVFLLTYYFTIAGSCWYVVLTVAWYLASVLKWGTEAISEKSGVFHACTWVASALLTVIVLLSDSIDGDSISGICFVGNQDYWNLLAFVLAPMGGLLVVGGLFLIRGFVSLVKIRSVIAREVRNFHKLEKLMIRIGVFGVLYTVNVLCVISAFIYEAWVRDQWVSAVNCGCSSGSGSRESKPAYSVLMIKYFMTLATGITSSIWVFSSKTVDTWKRFIVSLLPCTSSSALSSSSTNRTTTMSITNHHNNKQTHV